MFFPLRAIHVSDPRPRRERRDMGSKMLKQIAELNTLAVAELEARWRKLFGAAPPAHQRRFMVKRLAYRVQELTPWRAEPVRPRGHGSHTLRCRVRQGRSHPSATEWKSGASQAPHRHPKVTPGNAAQRSPMVECQGIADMPTGLSEGSCCHLAQAARAIPTLAFDPGWRLWYSIVSAHVSLVGQRPARVKAHNQERVTSSAGRAPLWRYDFL